MDSHELEARIVTALARPLPGMDAQLTLAPRPRASWPEGRSPANARAAAALLLAFADEERRVRIALTLRPGSMTHHAGQVSLPGGAVHEGESIEETALREAHEEIALDRLQVQVLGRLTPVFIPVSGFLLHPVIGIAHAAPMLRPDVREVARLLTPTLDELRDPTRRGARTVVREGQTVERPYVMIDGEQVWGATAMVLAEFLQLIAS